MTSLRRQKRCLFRDVSETSQKHLFQVFMIFQNYPKNMVSCDFYSVIEVSDKIGVHPLETLKKRYVFWEQGIAINHVSHQYQWVDICVRVWASQRSLKPNSKCIIYYFTILYLLFLFIYSFFYFYFLFIFLFIYLFIYFWLIRLYMTRCRCLN